MIVRDEGLSPITRGVSLILRRFVLITGILALSCYIWIYTREEAPAPIRSDGYSYYVYLPSWLLYGDTTLDALARDWYGGAYPQFTGITKWPATKRWVDPHPIGPALFMAPFFAGAHLLTRWSNLPPDGFSLYYQHAAGLAGGFYLLVGLAVLRRVLLGHFTEPVVLATLVTITWGTNLFHYGVFDSAFSHVYSFFLIAVLIALTERWWTEATIARSVGLGGTAAALVLTRHTNATFLLIPLLYGVASWRDVRQRAAVFRGRRGPLAIVVTVAAAGVLPQLAIYKAATGTWLVSPYTALDVGFRFRSPHLFGVLFSTEKGLFFWSPVLLMAVAGFFTARGWARSLVLPAAIIVTANTYLIASWSDWQFGGSYGHRGFTDGLALLAVFLAAFFAWAAERTSRAQNVGTAAALAVLLSIAQMLQYWLGILPIANTTWEQYRTLFLRFP